MITISDKSNCSGCTACKSICGKQAISMKSDALGFKYPIVDINKCVECGLCEKVCAFNEFYLTPDNFSQPYAFAARNKSIEEVEKSRSGGLFAAISDYVLDNDGVVYGAGYDSSFRVLHKRATDKNQRDELRGSKYVQSDMGTIFLDVARDLKNDLIVLFSGTPCQTAGLSSFLRLRKIKLDNLIICDIVCHGVPAPNIWSDYLKYIQHREGGKITKVNFRDKQRYGWTAHRESFEIDNTTYTTYTTTFYQHIMFRPSCGKCYYSNLRRTGDITLADYWGWQKTNPDINIDDKGVSLIFVNTNKGKILIERIKDRLILYPAKLEDCLQPNLQHPTQPHPKSADFAKDYESIGFEKTMKKYGFIGWKVDLKNIIGRIRAFCGKIMRILGLLK